MTYREILGKSISKYRKEKKISQENLAEKSGLHRTYIGAVERGERNISIDNIEKIANALEVELIRLFKDEREDDI